MIEHIQNTYKAIDADSLKQGILRELYTEDVVFLDPFHRIEGMEALQTYFTQLYKNVHSIDFAYGEAAQHDDIIFMEWAMTLRHPKLRRGSPVQVNGTTRFQIRDGRVCLHRDYMDTAQMLYENLPILGGVIRSIKQRMGQ